MRYSPSSRSISSASPLHAQPLGWWQVSPEAMQLSPHAWPFVQTLQHCPVIRRHVSQLAAPNISTSTVTILITLRMGIERTPDRPRASAASRGSNPEAR